MIPQLFDSWAQQAQRSTLSIWSGLPGLLLRLGGATLRVAVTIAAARLLLRMTPTLERFVVRRATLAPGAKLTDTANDAAQRIATLTKVVVSIARAVIGGIAAVMSLAAVGLDVAPLIAGAGIAGVAVGFGAQSVVKDFFSGFFILLESQFDVGDLVTINGITGTVEEMTMRVTVLRDAVGAQHYLPNGAIGTVTNRSASWLRATLDVATPINAPAANVRAALEAVVAAVSADPDFKQRLTGVIEIDGPLELNAERVTWRIQAQVRPSAVNQARERLIEALQKTVPLNEKGGLAWERCPQVEAPTATAPTH